MPKGRGKAQMKTKLLGLWIEPDVYERLRVRAFEQRCSVGEVVRRAIGAYLLGKPKKP
jgi:hypothetical protein